MNAVSTDLTVQLVLTKLQSHPNSQALLPLNSRFGSSPSAEIYFILLLASSFLPVSGVSRTHWLLSAFIPYSSKWGFLTLALCETAFMEDVP